MTERLNELSNNVLITLQSGKKITEAVVSLRELYLYLFKHSVPLPSTTYNYLLNAIQVCWFFKLKCYKAAFFVCTRITGDEFSAIAYAIAYAIVFGQLSRMTGKP